MQSEHMKELLFTIHPFFFNLTHEVGKGRRLWVGQQEGASAGDGGQPVQDQPGRTNAWPSPGHSRPLPDHDCRRWSDSGGDYRPAPVTAMAGEAAGGHNVVCGGDWSDFATYCRGGGEGEKRQQQRHLARLGHGAGRERGREERERENGEHREQGLGLGL